MRSIHNLFAARLLLAALCWSAARSGGAQTIAAIDIVGHLPLTEYNASIGTGTMWGNEPFVAVNPLNFKQVAVSSFAYDTPGASLWYSTNAGANWGIRFPITPNPAAGFTAPRDQTYAYDSSGTLHGVLLASSGSNNNVYHGSTADPSKDGVNGRPASVWAWTSPAVNSLPASDNIDQPWLAISGSRLYVAYDDFGGPPERVVRSTDGGATFPAANDLIVGKASAFTNPGTRVTTDAAGNAYVIFGVGTGTSNGVQNVTYHLNRFTGGAAWDYTSNVTVDGAGGLVIDSGKSTQIDDGTGTTLFGGKNDLRGNITAIAADRAGANIYTVYGKQDASGIDRLMIADFTPTGAGGNLVQRPNPVTFSVSGQRSALPSVAVTDSGEVGVLYLTSPSTDNFQVHFAFSLDKALTFTDSLIYSFNTSAFPLPNPYPADARFRLLGDYLYLSPVGNTFYGTFPGVGNVNFGSINTTGKIVPFFFIVGSHTTQYWDGTHTMANGMVAGGSGIWDNTMTNWTDAVGATNGPFTSGVAIFAGPAGGTVTLGAQIQFTGLEFNTDGYVINGAGAFTLGPINNAPITTAPGVTATINAPIDGAGALTKNGAGSLVLGGTNSYTGGTTINAGVLGIFNDNNLGDPVGGLIFDNNATLKTLAGVTFDSARTFTINSAGGTIDLNSFISTLNGAISGAGVFTVTDSTGNGTLSLTNDNSRLTGGFKVTNGAALQVSADNQLGSVLAPLTLSGGILHTTGSFSSARPVHLTNGTVNQFNVDPSVMTTLDSLIDGAGELAKTNMGTLVLTNAANTYSGGTVLEGGILILNANSTPSGSGPVANGPIGTGQLSIINGTLGSTVNNTLVANNISVQGDFSVAPPVSGDLFLNGNVSLSGTHTITSHNTQSTTHFGGAIQGVGFGLNLADAVPPSSPNSFNRFFFEGMTANTYTGLTTVMKNAYLHLAKTDGVTAIAGDLIINFGGSVALDSNEQIANTSTVTINSTGIVGSTNPAGFLLAGHTETIGALFGNGTVALDDELGGPAGILTIGAGNFSGVISDSNLGNGKLIKDTSGILILAAANTYTSETDVNGGLLQLGGSIASANTFVNAGGTLGGTGVIAGTLTNTAGIISPGDSPGKLTVKGNFTQASAGTLQIEVAGLALANHDLLAIGGRATLHGTLLLVRTASFAFGRNAVVTFLTADGGVNGTFDSVNGLDAFSTGTILMAEIIYDANAISLEAIQGLFAALPGLTLNEHAVAQNLDTVTSDPRANNLINFLDAEPLGKLPNDLDLISPSDLTSLYEVSFSGANVQRFNLTNRMAEVREGSTGFSSTLSISRQQLPVGKDEKGVVEPVLQPSPENRWGVFVTGDGDFVSVGGDGNAHGYDFTTAGVTLGVDCRLTNNVAIGLMGGYAHTWTNLARGGRVGVDTGKVGLYTTWWERGFYVDGFVGGGFNTYDTTRGALQGFANGRTDGAEFDTFFNVGYDARIGNWRFGPYATAAYAYVGLNNYTESGSLAPLDIVSQHQDSLRTDLGFRAEYRIKAGGVELRPYARAAWEHEYLYGALPIDAGLASGAGGIFTVYGPAEGHDCAIIGAGLSIQLPKDVLLYLAYDGQIGRERYASHAVAGGLRWSF
jgi:autotransporter-associated beta strand protein